MQIEYSLIWYHIWIVSRFQKRQAFDECFKSSRKKQEVLFVKTLIYKEHVIQKDQKTEMNIHMNINVEMNVIS